MTNHRIFQHFCCTFKLFLVLRQTTPWGIYFLFSVQHYWRSVFCSLNSYIICSTNTISLSFCIVGWDLWVSEFFKMTVSADKVCLAQFQLISSSIKTSFSVMFLPICFCHSSNRIHTIKSDSRLCRHYHSDAWSMHLNSIGLKLNGSNIDENQLLFLMRTNN